MLHTVFMSGLAVTICLSAGKDLFCLNSTSPATIRIVNTRNWHKRFIKNKTNKKYILFLPLNIKIKFKKTLGTNSSCQVQASIDSTKLYKTTSFQNPFFLKLKIRFVIFRQIICLHERFIKHYMDSHAKTEHIGAGARKYLNVRFSLQF